MVESGTAKQLRTEGRAKCREHLGEIDVALLKLSRLESDGNGWG